MTRRDASRRLAKCVALIATLSGAVTPGTALIAATAQPLNELTVKSYNDPGLPFLRAAVKTMAEAGVSLKIAPIKGHWYTARPTWANPAVRQNLLAGGMVTTGMRRLTTKEKTAGLREVVIGYLAAVIAVHPDAPIQGINTAKWKQVIKSDRPFTWRDIAADAQLIADRGPVTGPNPIDQAVFWSFPDRTHAQFARSFIGLGALSPALIKSFPPGGRGHTPAVSSHIIADHKDRIGVFGYDLIHEDKIHPLKPVRILKVDGVYPSASAVADGTYAFARPVTIVYGATFASKPDHPVAQLVATLKSERSTLAAKGQPFLFRRF